MNKILSLLMAVLLIGTIFANATAFPALEESSESSSSDQPVTTVNPKYTYDTLIVGQPGATIAVLRTAVSNYGGIISSYSLRSFKASEAETTITAHALFPTAETRSVFVTAVQKGEVAGVASAEPINPEDKKTNTGLIVGLVLGGVALLAIIVGIVIYRRRSNADGDYDNIDMRGRPSVPAKERAFV